MTSKWQQFKAIFGKPADAEPAYSMVLNQAQATFALGMDEWDSWATEAYQQNDLVCKGLNLIADSVVEADLNLESAGGEVLDREPGHMLLNHINDDMTPRDFLRKLILQMYIGNMAFIQKVRTKRGNITELGLLRPDRVALIRGTSGKPDYYEYNPGSHTKKIILPYEDVIVIRFTDVSSQFQGFSPLKSLYAYIDTSNELIRHVKSVLQNGGMPNSVLKVPDQLGDDQARTLAKSFDQRFGGDKKGKTCVLHGGIELEMVGFDFNQLDISTLSNFIESRILSGLGIPLPVYGSLTSTIASTYENMQTSWKMFWKQTVIPLQTMIEDALNHDRELLPLLNFMRGDKFRFDRTSVEALQENLNQASDRARADYQAGLITLNEARYAQGLEPLDGGDELKNINPNPLDSQPSPPAGNSTDMPVNNKSERKCCGGCCHKSQIETKPLVEGEDACSVVGMSNNIAKLVREGHTQEEAVAIAHNLCEQSRMKVKKKSEDFAIASKRLTKADKRTLPLGKLMDKHFKQQIDDVLGIINLKTQAREVGFEVKADSTSINEQIRQLISQWETNLFNDTQPVMGDLTQEAAKDAALTFGATFNISDALVQQLIKTQTFKFAQKVSQTSADKIQAIISEAFQAGNSLSEISQKITDLGEVWQGARSDMVARTETVRAANDGAKMGYKAAGVTKLRWSSVLDDNTSEICQALDGKIVGIDSPFLTDEDASGFDLSYENGSMENPPAHPNCRSTIIAEFED